MEPKKRSRLLMLFAAVTIFQCCCCIIPYSLSARFDSPTFAAPVNQEQDITLPPKETLKASVPSLFTVSTIINYDVCLVNGSQSDEYQILALANQGSKLEWIW
jgi:hypothetical protein